MATTVPVDGCLALVIPLVSHMNVHTFDGKIIPTVVTIGYPGVDNVTVIGNNGR